MNLETETKIRLTDLLSAYMNFTELIECFDLNNLVYQFEKSGFPKSLMVEWVGQHWDEIKEDLVWEN